MLVKQFIFFKVSYKLISENKKYNLEYLEIIVIVIELLNLKIVQIEKYYQGIMIKIIGQSEMIMNCTELERFLTVSASNATIASVSFMWTFLFGHRIIG